MGCSLKNFRENFVPHFPHVRALCGLRLHRGIGSDFRLSNRFRRGFFRRLLRLRFRFRNGLCVFFCGGFRGFLFCGLRGLFRCLRRLRGCFCGNLFRNFCRGLFCGSGGFLLHCAFRRLRRCLIAPGQGYRQFHGAAQLLNHGEVVISLFKKLCILCQGSVSVPSCHVIQQLRQLCQISLSVQKFMPPFREEPFSFIFALRKNFACVTL